MYSFASCWAASDLVSIFPLKSPCWLLLVVAGMVGDVLVVLFFNFVFDDFVAET